MFDSPIVSVSEADMKTLKCTVVGTSFFYFFWGAAIDINVARFCCSEHIHTVSNFVQYATSYDFRLLMALVDKNKTQSNN